MQADPGFLVGDGLEIGPGRGWEPGDHALDWTPEPGRGRFRSVAACETESWKLLLWPRACMRFEPETGNLDVDVGAPEPRRVPFYCGSWRCRRCRWWRNAVDFARLSVALQRRPWWAYVVLTTDPRRYADPWAAARAMGENWDHRLRRAFERALAAAGAGRLAYLQTWEVFTRTRWPHCNLLLAGEGLREWIYSYGDVRRVPGGSGRRERAFPAGWRRRWLGPAAVRAGFGLRVWVEEVGGAGAMAAYLVKLAKEIGMTSAKAGQLPLDAPPGFRRIRASQDLLPPGPRAGGGPMTGTLERGAAPWGRTAPAREPGKRGTAAPASWGDVMEALRCVLSWKRQDPQLARDSERAALHALVSRILSGRSETPGCNNSRTNSGSPL